MRAALERFRAELGPSGYLAADRFTVADLTLAALLAPGVVPVGFPHPPPAQARALLADVRELIDSYGAGEWVEEMYARHRGTSKEISP